MDPPALAMLAGVGVVAGWASGLLGIGGGVIMVPALVLLLGLGFAEAVAASLLVMCAVTPWGVWRHWRAGHVDLRSGALLGVSGFAGVLLATWVQPALSERVLLLAFAGVLAASARHLLYGTMPAHRLRKPALMLAFGLVAGLVAKLFGIGGGIIMVPGLVFLGHSMHLAVGTSLGAVWTNAVLSTGINVAGGLLPWQPALALAVGSVGGIVLGAAHALRAHAAALKRGFAIVLVATALAMAARSVG